MVWIELIFFVLTVLVGSTTGFRCHVCSYSSNSDHTTVCLTAPELLTAPENYYACNRSCFIQENYSLQEKKVTSFTRSCVNLDGEGCTQDAWSIVCWYSCRGELCNDYRQPLHDLFPVQGQNGRQRGPSSGGSPASRHSPSLTLYVAICALTGFNLIRLQVSYSNEIKFAFL